MDGFGRGWGAVCWWETFLVMFVVCGLGRAVAQGFGGFGGATLLGLCCLFWLDLFGIALVWLFDFWLRVSLVVLAV